jgi:hypothetical protein
MRLRDEGNKLPQTMIHEEKLTLEKKMELFAQRLDEVRPPVVENSGAMAHYLGKAAEVVRPNEE